MRPRPFAVGRSDPRTARRTNKRGRSWATSNTRGAGSRLSRRPRRSEGQVWHPQFGWLPAEHVPRYEGGERTTQIAGSWPTTSDVCDPHTRKGWDIVTEHYNVHTTHSLEEGVRLATRLERLYDAWQQMLPASTPTAMAVGPAIQPASCHGSMPQRHKVHLLSRPRRIRPQAVKEEPNIGVSAGVLSAPARRRLLLSPPTKTTIRT